MPDFSRIITMAYMRILGRPPDPGGLENYNRHMNDGMSEALMRESLLRSPEYADKHPDRKPPVVRVSSPSPRRTRLKKTTKKRSPPGRVKRSSSRR